MTGFPWPSGELPSEQQARDFAGAAGVFSNDDARSFILSQPAGRTPGWRVALVAALILAAPSAWRREAGDDSDYDAELVPLGRVLDALEERRERVALGRSIPAKLAAFLVIVDDAAVATEEIVVDGVEVEIPTLDAMRRIDEGNPLPSLQEEWRGWITERWGIEQEGRSLKLRLTQETERLRLLRRHGHVEDAAKSAARIAAIEHDLVNTRQRWSYYNRKALVVEAEIKAMRAEQRR